MYILFCQFLLHSRLYIYKRIIRDIFLEEREVLTYDNLPIMNSFQIEFKPLGMDLNNFEFTKSFNFGESIFPSVNITPYTFNTTNFLGSNFNNSFNFGFNLTNSINIYGFNNNLTPKISLTSSTNKNQKTYNNTASAVNTSTWNNFVKTYGVTEKTINGVKYEKI